MVTETDKASDLKELSSKNESLIFISHDTRDAAIAEAFSSLLKSVSAGVLKSFRSSDKKGNQGIEFGVEWYPQIMKKLEVASDVVCLLTPNSVNRPWILYEAGVAKGKLETPVHGIALGIPLQVASSGPFAQFQNSDDNEDSLTQLVMQLVSRIPNAEPDRDVVKMQVAAFKAKIAPLLSGQDAVSGAEHETEEASVAKIFEEIKVMFQDLPSRIERQVDPRNSKFDMRSGKMRFRMVDELFEMNSKEFGSSLKILIIASEFREDVPWLYDIALETHRKIDSGSPDSLGSLRKLVKIFDMMMHSEFSMEMRFRNKERGFRFEESLHFAMRSLGQLSMELENQYASVRSEVEDNAQPQTVNVARQRTRREPSESK
jgi:TIR domain